MNQPTDEGTKEPTMERTYGNCNGRTCGNLSAIDERDALIAELREKVAGLTAAKEACIGICNDMRESNAAKDAEIEKLSAAGVYLAEQNSLRFRQLASLAAALHVDTFEEIAQLAIAGQEVAALKQQLAERDRKLDILGSGAEPWICPKCGAQFDDVRCIHGEVHAVVAERNEARASLSETVSVLDDLLGLYGGGTWDEWKSAFDRAIALREKQRGGK